MLALILSHGFWRQEDLIIFHNMHGYQRKPFPKPFDYTSFIESSSTEWIKVAFERSGCDGIFQTCTRFIKVCL